MKIKEKSWLFTIIKFTAVLNDCVFGNFTKMKECLVRSHRGWKCVMLLIFYIKTNYISSKKSHIFQFCQKFSRVHHISVFRFGHTMKRQHLFFCSLQLCVLCRLGMHRQSYVGHYLRKNILQKLGNVGNLKKNIKSGIKWWKIAKTHMKSENDIFFKSNVQKF